MMVWHQKVSNIFIKKYPGWGMVAGAVLLAGRISIHETGMRSSLAIPIAFLDTSSFSSIPEVHGMHEENASKLYHAPLLPFYELEDYARQIGETIDPDIHGRVTE
jgi:hypothetical protein